MQGLSGGNVATNSLASKMWFYFPFLMKKGLPQRLIFKMIFTANSRAISRHSSEKRRAHAPVPLISNQFG
jgi:hypothetical protein